MWIYVRVCVFFTIRKFIAHYKINIYKIFMILDKVLFYKIYIIRDKNMRGIWNAQECNNLRMQKQVQLIEDIIICIFRQNPTYMMKGAY